MKENQVKEVQGLYGPFSLSEKVVQKIWLRQDFDNSELKTTSGRTLEVIDPGRWNLLAGPDFKDAQLRLDGAEISGDVEIHFNVNDWSVHGHQHNPEFDRVVLHVVVYNDPKRALPVKTFSGSQPELLILLPVLSRDLEDYAIDDALRELEKVEELDWEVEFLERSFNERQDLVVKCAAGRWARKLKFAEKRLATDGWEASLHQLCLEVLGYGRNRGPMARLGINYPIEDFRSQKLDEETLFRSEAAGWKLNGSRPANHPKLRLRQYLQIMSRAPDWPEQLRSVLGQQTEASATMKTADFRRSVGLRDLCDALRIELLGEVIGEKRFHTLMVDAFLPLAAAEGLIEGYPYWRHWWPGDNPDSLSRLLKRAGLVTRPNPLSNGLLQGVLGLSIRKG
ncbi:MAG: DUF2851 family protein [Verrucomicrobiota bacterium]